MRFPRALCISHRFALPRLKSRNLGYHTEIRLALYLFSLAFFFFCLGGSGELSCFSFPKQSRSSSRTETLSVASSTRRQNEIGGFQQRHRRRTVMRVFDWSTKSHDERQTGSYETDGHPTSCDCEERDEQGKYRGKPHGHGMSVGAHRHSIHELKAPAVAFASQSPCTSPSTLRTWTPHLGDPIIGNWAWSLGKG